MIKLMVTFFLVASCAPAPQSDLANSSQVESGTVTDSGGANAGTPQTKNASLGQTSAEKTVESNTSLLSCKLNASAAAVVVGGKLKLTLVASGGVSSVDFSNGLEMDLDTLTADVDTKVVGSFTVTANVSGPAGDATCSASYTVESPLTCTVKSSAATVYVGAPGLGDSTTLTVAPSIPITTLTLDGNSKDKNTLSFTLKPPATHEYVVVVGTQIQTATCKVNVLVSPRYSR